MQNTPEGIEPFARLLARAMTARRPIGYHVGGGKWIVPDKIKLHDVIERYRVQPEPALPQYRPFTLAELKIEAKKGTIVEEYYEDADEDDVALIGSLQLRNSEVLVCECTVSLDQLCTNFRFANPADPRYGQPVGVLIDLPIQPEE